MKHQDDSSLVGWWFHMIAYYNGKRTSEQVGKVVSRPEPGWYLIELFSTTKPEKELERKLVKFDLMHDWKFYPDMSSALDTFYGKPAENGNPK